MSMTLNLADRLLSMGRHFRELGRNQDALRILGRLAGFRDLAPEVAEETQVHLAEIQLARQHFTRARRHLTAALVHQPQSARYHYLMATALAGDPRADHTRAADHYRQSLKLHPEQPACLAEYGLLALRLGQTDEGLASLLRAVELAPNDATVVGSLAQGLTEEGRREEARSILRAALFRNPRSIAFRKLWESFQFDELRRKQAVRAGNGTDCADDTGAKILPFVIPAPNSVPSRLGQPIIRRDPPGTPGRPHRPQGAPVSDQRHAQ